MRIPHLPLDVYSADKFLMPWLDYVHDLTLYPLAVASTFALSPAVVAAGITVDNVFGLLYFPLVSLAGRQGTRPASMQPRDGDDDGAAAEGAASTIETPRPNPEHIHIEKNAKTLPRAHIEPPYKSFF
jgi:hypothetical protein